MAKKNVAKIFYTIGLVVAAVLAPLKEARAAQKTDTIKTKTVKTLTYSSITLPAIIPVTETGEFDSVRAKKMIEDFNVEKNMPHIQKLAYSLKNGVNPDKAYSEFAHDISAGDKEKEEKLLTAKEIFAKEFEEMSKEAIAYKKSNDAWLIALGISAAIFLGTALTCAIKKVDSLVSFILCSATLLPPAGIGQWLINCKLKEQSQADFFSRPQIIEQMVYQCMEDSYQEAKKNSIVIPIKAEEIGTLLKKGKISSKDILSLELKKQIGNEKR